MKKVFCTLVAAAALTLVACSSANTNNADADTTAPVEAMAAPSIEDTYGEWTINEVCGTPVDGKATLTLNADGTFGAVICNSFSGIVVQRGRSINAFGFENVARTDRMGDPIEMAIEDTFAQTLDSVRHFDIVNGTLLLKDDNDEVLISCQR